MMSGENNKARLSRRSTAYFGKIRLGKNDQTIF